MDDTGKQLHPNWQTLATVHIPLKRFIQEGSTKIRNEKSNIKEKYEISEDSANEIKVFYEELIFKEGKGNAQNLIKNPTIRMAYKSDQLKLTEVFDSRIFFRYSMENRVDKLEKIDFKNQNLDICDSYGWTALMMACCEGAYDAVKFLLSIGVNRYIRDKSGKSARDLVYIKGYNNIVELLKSNPKKLLPDITEEVLYNQEPFFCDVCQQNFQETSKDKHLTSTVHQFHLKSNSSHKLQKFNINFRNKGLQIMVKQGWDKESGLGPSQSGRLYPVKTVIRKQRTGLGVEQNPARVTHFISYDYKTVIRRNSHSFKKNNRNRNDIRSERVREWKQNRRLRNELN